MPPSSGAQGSGIQPAIAPIIPTGTREVAREERPPASAKEEARAQDFLQEQIINETCQNRQQISTNFVRTMRARLWAETRLNMQQINHLLSQTFNAGNPLPYQNSEAVFREARGGDLPPALPREGSAQPDARSEAGAQQQPQGLARESRGAGLARMERGQQAAPTPSGTPPPRTPPPPSQPVAASFTPPPPPPVPGAPMPRADATRGQPQPPLADGVPQPDAPVVAADAFVPGDASPVPTRTAEVRRNPIPDAPRRPQGMQGESRTLLGTTDRRGVLPSDETLDNFHTTAVRAQFVLRGNVPQAPIPVPVRAPNDTFVARTREPSTTKTGERREGGEDRAGGSLDRSLALGMRRQFRDTAC